MKFIPKTNKQYQFDEKGNVFSLKRNRYLKETKGFYSIIFEHGRRNIRKKALVNLYQALNTEMIPISLCSNYAITKNGFVYSYITNCEIKMFYNKEGYARTSLVADDGIRRKYSRCRLVALTFIENPTNKPCVNHKDGNKLNDNVDNLEWVTVSENTIHAWNNGLIKRNRDKNGKFI